MSTTAKSNVKSTTRRKPAQSAQERPAAQVVQFPMFAPKPRQTDPHEVKAMVRACASDAAQLRLIPDPDAVVLIMNETFGTLGWTRRYYFADGRLWCGVGVYHPLMNNFAIKDAAAPAGKLQISNPDKWKENGSFLAACALWGAGADVMALPSIVIDAVEVPKDGHHMPQLTEKQVLIERKTATSYCLHGALTVDKLLRADDGHIIGVQFLQGERKVVWQAE